jgi:hypothetical protein
VAQIIFDDLITFSLSLGIRSKRSFFGTTTICEFKNKMEAPSIVSTIQKKKGKHIYCKTNLFLVESGFKGRMDLKDQVLQLYILLVFLISWLYILDIGSIPLMVPGLIYCLHLIGFENAVPLVVGIVLSSEFMDEIK